MPELPEVETTCRGIAPHVTGHRILRLTVHDGRLRWPVPETLPAAITGQAVSHISRRGKYILLHTAAGIMMVHLGMSGSLRLVAPDTPRKPHDHLVWLIDSGWELRFHDPRRFGCCLWLTGELLAAPEQHPLLASLGPEPLSADFGDDHLFHQSRGKSAPVKSFLMDSHVVVGVGNIYANEALFRVGIH
ncbi:MAG: bifunctional DNA-formamidopyrimidine glycosylase/DNA-(apurinic or apyrimidinic site) lyase, partial [Perlucidibaca sp.]